MSVNTRTASYRRFRDLYDGYATLLGGNPSLPQQNLIRRLATHDVALERYEGDLASGVPIDMSAYGTLANVHRRIMESLGLATPAEKVSEIPNFDAFDMAKLRFVRADGTIGPLSEPDPAAEQPEVPADA